MLLPKRGRPPRAGIHPAEAGIMSTSLNTVFAALSAVLEAHTQDDIPVQARLADCRRWYLSDRPLAWTHLIQVLEAHLGYAITLR